MDKFRRASTVMLDRWSIEVTNTPHSDELRPKVFYLNVIFKANILLNGFILKNIATW